MQMWVSPRVLLTLCTGVLMSASPVLAQQAGSRCSPDVRTTDVAAMDLEALLNARIITASRFAEHESDAPGIISVVTRDEIRRFGGTTLRDVLERVPGLTGTTAYFTERSMVAARGDQTKIDAGHVLVLINGRPTREILEGGVTSDVFESFPIAVLERIEVVRGPGSVLYGSNAFSAVINLITTEAATTGFAMTGAGASGSAFAASGTATLRCGDLSVVAAAQIHERARWQTTYRIPESLLDDPLAPPVPLAQTVSIRDRGPGGFLDVRYKGFSAMGALSGYNTSSFVRGTVSGNEWGRAFGDIGYAFTPAGEWDSGVNFTFTRTTLDVPAFPWIHRDSHEMIVEWTNSLKAARTTQLSFGTLYNHIEGRETYHGLTPAIPISDGSRHGAALYGQVNQGVTEYVNLIGGFQANKIGELDLDVVPRGGVIVHVGPRVHVKALYSKAFRAPSLNENFLDHPGLTGRVGLRPEKVGTFDLAVTYHGRRLQGNVSYFRSRQTDSIIVDTSTPRWSYRNLGEATFHGAEADGKYFLHRDLMLLGSVLYQTNKDGLGNRDVTPVANFGAKGGISYQARQLTLSVFDSYQGSLEGYSQGANPEAGAYHLLSSRARLDISNWLGSRGRGLALFVQGDNLTDREVWLPDWGGNSGDTVPVHRGRTVYFGVEIF